MLQKSYRSPQEARVQEIAFQLSKVLLFLGFWRLVKQVRHVHFLFLDLVKRSGGSGDPASESSRVQARYKNAAVLPFTEF